jgi:ribose 5-phosphate isomerase B
MKVAVGSDHAGLDLKEKVVKYLAEEGFEVHDLGTTNHDRVDYPDFAAAVAAEVSRGKAECGILVCATGVGVCIAANKIDGIRAASAWNIDIARLSRQHNDANVLCLSGCHLDHQLALQLVHEWLTTGFEGGRHKARVDKITSLEQSN